MSYPFSTETQVKLDRLESLGQRVADLNEERKTLVREALKEGFDAVFEAFPEVKSISWTQYAPYFNDGDACVFHVHDYNINLFKDHNDEDDDDYYDDDYGNWSFGRPKSFNVPVAKNYSDFYQQQIDLAKEGKGHNPERAIERYTELLNDPKTKIADVITSFTVGVDEDLMKDIYGDDCKVTISREGTDIGETYHE